MNVRSWTVGVFSAAAMVAGVVAVQSGIAGTAALPILPHHSAAAIRPELPAPTEVRSRISAPPSAGAMQQAPAAPVAVVPDQPSNDPGSTADRPAKRPGHERSGGNRDGHGGAGKDSGPSSGHDSGHGSGHDSHGGGGKD